MVKHEGDVLVWRATLRRGRLGSLTAADATERVPPIRKLRRYRHEGGAEGLWCSGEIDCARVGGETGGVNVREEAQRGKFWPRCKRGCRRDGINRTYSACARLCEPSKCTTCPPERSPNRPCRTAPALRPPALP